MSYLKNIVYKAKKQNDIVIKHENIKFFWKAQVNVCRNLLDNFSDTYNNLMKELEDNLILANSIFEDPTERSRVKRDK